MPQVVTPLIIAAVSVFTLAAWWISVRAHQVGPGDAVDRRLRPPRSVQAAAVPADLFRPRRQG
jgi:hypothetical protein